MVKAITLNPTRKLKSELLGAVCSVLSICINVYNMHIRCSQRPEEGIGTLKLDLQMAVSHHMGAGN